MDVNINVLFSPVLEGESPASCLSRFKPQREVHNILWMGGGGGLSEHQNFSRGSGDQRNPYLCGKVKAGF